MQIALSGQSNILELPLVAKASGNPITIGVVNMYVVDKDGSNANKWYRASDGSWQSSESISGVATHRADGHWYHSFPSAVWTKHKRYDFYAKESGNLHIPVGDDTFVNAMVRTAIAVVGQANVLSLPLVAKASGDPITTGTVNFYLYDKDGSNAGKYYNADTTWTIAEAVAGVAAHRADGHWYLSFPTAVWEKNVRYRFYAKESGDLHIPVGMDILADTLSRVTSGSEKLQTSPASIMKEYIVRILGSMTDPSDGSAWPLYINAMPDGKPSEVETECGAVYDTTGIQDLRDMRGPIPDHQGIQLRIRARDYETAFAKIEDIMSDLDAVADDSIIINSLEYNIDNVSRQTPVINLGLERNATTRRFILTVNFLLTVREIS